MKNSTFVLALLIPVLFGFYPAHAQPAGEIPSTTYLRNGWQVRSSEGISREEVISGQSSTATGWFKATVPSTVMGVLTSNGLFPDIFTGENYRDVDRKPFDVSWWYRNTFTFQRPGGGTHAILHFDGLNYAANIWLNGKQIASRDTAFGPYRRYQTDVTRLLEDGENTLSVELFRAMPGDFNLGFVDWNPRPADENMGIWREVSIRLCGLASMDHLYVDPRLNTETLDEASLRISTEVTNYSGLPLKSMLRGTIGDISFNYPVSLAPGVSTLVLDPEKIPELLLKHPRIWWCNNLGNPELYQLSLQMETGNMVSDRMETTFGVRHIEMYTNEQGHKGFNLNGKKILIKGAGWTDELFLRDSLESLEAQVQYVKHMNLNAIRLESIWGKTQDLFDLCDKYGILVMAGWSCQWEWDEYLGKECDDYGGIRTEEDMQLAVTSLRDQVRWLRNHPSIFVWLIGSDKLPRPELEIRYRDMLQKYDSRPYLTSAGTRTSTVSGPTGVKMNGPYEYVAPVYWYQDTVNGGAFGFNTETGPGPQMLCESSFRKMIPADKLWPVNKTWDYHCTHSKQAFNTPEVFNAALDRRYGASDNFMEYLLKSEVQSYEALRAMFEAFRSKIPVSTGIIQWMLNNAWPSLYWHLYDYYLHPSSAFYATRKANAPVQLVYDYHTGDIHGINESLVDIKSCKALVSVVSLTSGAIFSKEYDCSLPGNTSVKLINPGTFGEPVFLSLKLKDEKGVVVSDNFYWLSPVKDEFAWERTSWAYTPMSKYADFMALNNLAPAPLLVSAERRMDGAQEKIVVHLSNPGAQPAFFVELELEGKDGESLVPVFWDDNYISMLPGESREITCRAGKELLSKNNTGLVVRGWNVPEKHLPVK